MRKLFCASICVLAFCICCYAQKTLRIFNLDREWVPHGPNDANEQFPYLIQLPTGHVFQLYSGVLSKSWYFEVIGAADTVLLKMRIADNSGGPPKALQRWIMQTMDTTLSIPAGTLPSGDYALVKNVANGRVGFTLKPVAPGTKAAKRARKGKRVLTYDASTATVQSKRPWKYRSLDAVWPKQEHRGDNLSPFTPRRSSTNE